MYLGQISVNPKKINGYNMIRRKAGVALYLFLLFFSAPCRAEPSPMATSNMLGTLGLNSTPSARMDRIGTLRTTISRQGPYTHAIVSSQISDRLYLGLRQTSRSSGFWSDSDALYPGIDAKLRLFNERRWRPEISVGLQSALDDNIMAAQYLVMSKHIHNWDITGGFGWGRMGTLQTLPNPVLFNKANALDWFQGDMGVFGGIQYNLTPELALKADWSSDSWHADDKHLLPWSVGLSYKPFTWLDAGIASSNQGVMAQLSFTPDLINWSPRMAETKPPVNLIPDRAKRAYDFRAVKSLGLGTSQISGNTAFAALDVNNLYPSPEQAGHALRTLANYVGPIPERLGVQLRHLGLQGPDLIIDRRDLEHSLLRHQGSAEEIWHHAALGHDLFKGGVKPSYKGFSNFTIEWRNDLSLTEEDSGVLYRAALIPSYTESYGEHFLGETAVRINLKDNLRQIRNYRSLSYYPVRGDVDVFTENRFVLERSYFAGFATLRNDLHVAGHIGYLEEMYGGAGGEILYRPFGKNWALGLETALALKRDPYSIFALNFNGDHIITSHLNGYYEIPDTRLTLHASAGRYLAGDIGAGLDLTQTFDNGVKISASTTVTNRRDADIIYGDTTYTFTGMSLTLPLGSLPFVSDGSKASFNAQALGRNTAQRLDIPHKLYNETDVLSYRHITRQWSRLLAP